METIISSSISAAVAIIVCLINSHMQAKKMDADRARSDAMIEFQISALTEQVKKHNSVVERMTIQEIKEAETRKDVDVLFDRVREIEKGAKG